MGRVSRVASGDGGRLRALIFLPQIVAPEGEWWQTSLYPSTGPVLSRRGAGSSKLDNAGTEWAMHILVGRVEASQGSTGSFAGDRGRQHGQPPQYPTGS